MAPAASDWVLGAYLTTVMAGLAAAEPSPERNHYLLVVAAIAALFLFLVFLFRLRLDPRRHHQQPLRSPALVVYRLLALPAFLVLYLQLRAILPTINGAVHDAVLYQLDLRLFGFEPTLALERISTRPVVEWFAFFYYLYFYLMGAYILLIVLFDRVPRRQAFFATGLLMVLSIGQFGYTLVPGYGPYAHLGQVYRSELQGGYFYGLVWRAVSAQGPLRDIFPSLHTAVPAYLTLFSWQHYRRAAPVTTFVTVNIVLATMVLRWHWAVDCLAGLALAFMVWRLAPCLVDRYQRLRARGGMPAELFW